jgi:hypothetical protein
MHAKQQRSMKKFILLYIYALFINLHEFASQNEFPFYKRSLEELLTYVFADLSIYLSLKTIWSAY